MTKPESSKPSYLEQTRVYRSGVEDLCEQFETAWSEKSSEAIEDWLGRVDSDHRQTLLKELLLIDIELRKRKGFTTDENDYLVRFPDDRDIVRDAWIQVNQYLRSGSRKVDVYELRELLGRGGMGEAWKAYDEVADRFVVLKFVPKEILHVREAIDSVRDSFRKVHELQHQHICPVYGLFDNPDHGLYLVMKFVDGQPLDEYKRRFVEKHGKMSFSDIVQILWGIAKGLDYAHEKRVIHRDIKPQNVMISKKDGVQIIDFGLAEEIRTSMAQFSEVAMEVSGTRPYMAPEQWRGRLQDARTDQYALAVTAYELFAGHVPFQGGDVGILRECVLHDEPEPISDLPDHVNAALLKALSKKREDRFFDCKTFVKAMATKPKESTPSDDAPLESIPSQQSDPLALPSDRAVGVTPPPAWAPQTMMNSQADSVIRQSLPWKRSILKWAFPIAIASLFLLAGFLGIILFPSSVQKPNEAPDPAAAFASQEKTEPEKMETVKSVKPAFFRTEPVFPKEIRDIRSVDELIPKLALFIVKDLHRDIGVFSDSKHVFVSPSSLDRLPSKVDAFSFIQFRAWDHAPVRPEVPIRWPCVSKGFHHKDAPCCCFMLPEDYALLNRLKGRFRCLNLYGWHYNLSDWDILFQDGLSLAEFYITCTNSLPHWDYLGRFDCLEIFEAGHNDVTPRHLEALLGHVKLRDIRLSQSRFAPDSFKTLAQCRSNVLRLDECMLSEQDVDDLGQTTSIAALSFKGTPIGNDGLHRLGSTSGLKKIHIDSGTRVTASGLKAFREKYPGVEIVVPQKIVLPSSFEDVPEARHEINLSDVLWETASVKTCSPGPFKLKSDHGENESSLWAAAPSKIVFKPNKKWKTLISGIALVDESGKADKRPGRINGYMHMPGDSPGTVIFVVKGDGKELYRSELITDSSEKNISVDISGVDTLELIVEDGGDGPRFDAAAWFDPKLIRDVSTLPPEKIISPKEPPPLPPETDLADPKKYHDFLIETMRWVHGARQGNFWAMADGKERCYLPSEPFPDNIEKIGGVSFPIIDRMPRFAASSCFSPCIVPGYVHRSMPCTCRWRPEELQRLSLLKNQNGCFFEGHSLALEDLDLLLKRKPFTGLELTAIPTLPDWKPIKQYHQLSWLILGNNDLSSSHLETLAALPQVHDLVLNGSVLTEGGKPLFLGGKSIAKLSLNESTSLSEDDFKSLATMKNLSELSLVRTAVHDSDLLTLIAAANLKKIQLGNNGITAKGFDEFKKQRPDVEVVLKDQTDFPIRFEDVGQEVKELYLADVTWESVKTRFGGVGPQTLKSVQGKYDRSFFAPAPSRIVFRPGKKWQQFNTKAGLLNPKTYEDWRKLRNYAHMPGGDTPSIVFVVKGDDKELYRSELITNSNEQKISVDISGVDTLELIVEDGGDGARFDAAAWFDPKLTRDVAEDADQSFFPKEFQEIQSLDELQSKMTRYLADDLKYELNVVSDGKRLLVEPRHPENRPEKIDAFESLALWPPDLVRTVPGRFSGKPCRSPGFCHLHCRCHCSLLPEDCRLLNRLKEPIGLLVLNGLHLDSANLEILFQNGPKIRDLQLQFVSAIPDLKPLLHLEGLQSLHLTYTDLQPSQLETIARLPNLTMLNLSGTRLAPGSLVALKKSPKLNHLHITWGVQPLTEREFNVIAEFPHLTELDVKGTLLMDSGLEILARCPRLKKIYLDATCRFTAEGLEAFRKKRPDVEIDLPKDLKLPVRLESIADSEKEVFLGEILFEEAKVEVSAPGSESIDTDSGKMEKSIWAAAPSRIVYRPKKKWRTFQSGIALVKQHPILSPGNARPHFYLHMPGDSPGTVVFVVKGDGRELYRSELISDTKVQDISVDISGVDTLELIVEDTEDGPRFDASAWFTPRLKR